MPENELGLIAHLLRRAGFGGTLQELEEYQAKGYKATVEELLRPEDIPEWDDDLVRRYQPDQNSLMYFESAQSYAMYKMINSKRLLEEKISLFWHGLFATAYGKLNHAKGVLNQTDTFRRHGLGSFHNILMELSRDPAMIFWLDNNENHKDEINENYGRELLELFSMGVGNYTEDDIKNASKAFTGWTFQQPLSLYPYGHHEASFKFVAEDHDYSKKEFLGHSGNFDGEDIIDIIVSQKATANFISRHLYNFFVEDEVQVPSWKTIRPKDPEAIELLSKTFTESQGDMRTILTVLFNSDFFKNSAFLRVKSPVELVIGTLRKTGEYQTPVGGETGIFTVMEESGFMGQKLLDPPSVEGWHTGEEWISSGSLVERVNFVTSHLGDDTHPGVKEMISKLNSITDKDSDPNSFVEACIDALGLNKIGEDTRIELVNVAREARENRNGEAKAGKIPQEVIIHMFKLIGSCKEYQLC